MKNKLEVQTKILEFKCYTCSGKGSVDKKPCKVCGATGIYLETFYYHIVNGMCFSGDTIK